ncbi:MAG: hypothetical protein ACK5ME_07260 [Parahaliea sp.]
MKTLLAAISGVLLIALPLLLLFGLDYLSARHLAAAFMVVAALRLILLPASTLALPRILPALLLVLALLVVLSGNTDWFLYYPLAVNTSLLMLFGLSLWRGPPLIEQLARLREPDLPAAAIPYTRRVTWLWCVFFLCNGTIALYTALYCSLQTWAFYNGLLAYLLIGLLLAIEWLVRQFVRQRAQQQARQEHRA